MKIEKSVSLPKQSKIKRAGVYCRVSSSKDDQMNSLANQVEKLMSDIVKNPDLKLFDVYVDVSSGRGKYERKNMERLKADCKAGIVDYIITKSVSRFYRDTEYLLRTVRELREIGVEIFFQNENVSSFDKDSELMLAIIGGVAQAESDDKSLNIKWGISKMRENPESKMNNRVFYGYRRDEDGKLIVDEEQAKVVKMIYDMFLDGDSILKIKRKLEEREILTSRGNDKWSKRSIEVILDDERYTGAIRIREGMLIKIIKEHRPAIISISTFQEVKRMRQKRSNVMMTEDGTIVRKSTRYSSPE